MKLPLISTMSGTMRARVLNILLCASLALGSASAMAEVLIEALATSAGPVRVESIVSGLQGPWSLAFLPDGRMLVSEKRGQLRIVSTDGVLSTPLAGVPKVQSQGQGGLLDIALSPHFVEDQQIFFSFSQPTENGARTAVARAGLNFDQHRLDNVQVIFAQQPDPDGRNHWGSRLVFGRDGTLFITLGDRFNHRDQAQRLDSHLGKIVRIQPDGSVPADNPFMGRNGVLPEIWSYGHRNVQGAALHPETGVLWTHEHGPQGGDELNQGVAGANYGWPEITYGREYVIGTRIGSGETRDDVTPPRHYWVPSIAPSGMSFYTGDRFPGWQGSVFIGALKAQMLVRLSLQDQTVVAEERLLGELQSRIRDVRQGPDDLLYLLDETHGRILRLSPAM